LARPRLRCGFAKGPAHQVQRSFASYARPSTRAPSSGFIDNSIPRARYRFFPRQELKQALALRQGYTYGRSHRSPVTRTTPAGHLVLVADDGPALPKDVLGSAGSLDDRDGGMEGGQGDGLDAVRRGEVEADGQGAAGGAGPTEGAGVCSAARELALLVEDGLPDPEMAASSQSCPARTPRLQSSRELLRQLSHRRHCPSLAGLAILAKRQTQSPCFEYRRRPTRKTRRRPPKRASPRPVRRKPESRPVQNPSRTARTTAAPRKPPSRTKILPPPAKAGPDKPNSAKAASKKPMASQEKVVKAKAAPQMQVRWQKKRPPTAAVKKVPTKKPASKKAKVEKDHLYILCYMPTEGLSYSCRPAFRSTQILLQ
jgi:hypothetical protein